MGSKVVKARNRQNTEVHSPFFYRRETYLNLRSLKASSCRSNPYTR